MLHPPSRKSARPLENPAIAKALLMTELSKSAAQIPITICTTPKAMVSNLVLQTTLLLATIVPEGTIQSDTTAVADELSELESVDIAAENTAAISKPMSPTPFGISCTM